MKARIETRKELQGRTAEMPEQKPAALKPLLSEMAKPEYTVEPASPAESRRADRRFRQYRENPASFVPLKD